MFHYIVSVGPRKVFKLRNELMFQKLTLATVWMVVRKKRDKLFNCFIHPRKRSSRSTVQSSVVPWWRQPSSMMLNMMATSPRRIELEIQMAPWDCWLPYYMAQRHVSTSAKHWRGFFQLYVAIRGLRNHCVSSLLRYLLGWTGLTGYTRLEQT